MTAKSRQLKQAKRAKAAPRPHQAIRSREDATGLIQYERFPCTCEEGQHHFIKE